MMNTSPMVRRQRLGAELRQLRDASRMTGDQVCEQLGWASSSKLSRIERGQSRPDLADVFDLLDLYGVVNGKREELVAVARDAASTKGWWRAFADMGQRQRGYAELETGATEIRQYSQFLVPGLLQTTEYARVRVLSTRDLYGDIDLDAETRARIARQAILRRANPPNYEAIIEEGALRRNVAPPDVLRAQLDRLIEFAELPNVTVRVVRWDAKVGEFYVPHAAFSLYRFADPEDPTTVALETLTSDVHLRDAEDVAMYDTAYGRLREAALSPESSLAFIERLAGE